jgi:hypothetical protein
VPRNDAEIAPVTHPTCRSPTGVADHGPGRRLIAHLKLPGVALAKVALSVAECAFFAATARCSPCAKRERLNQRPQVPATDEEQVCGTAGHWNARVRMRAGGSGLPALTATGARVGREASVRDQSTLGQWLGPLGACPPPTTIPIEAEAPPHPNDEGSRTEQGPHTGARPAARATRQTPPPDRRHNEPGRFVTQKAPLRDIEGEWWELPRSSAQTPSTGSRLSPTVPRTTTQSPARPESAADQHRPNRDRRARPGEGP